MCMGWRPVPCSSALRKPMLRRKFTDGFDHSTFSRDDIKPPHTHTPTPSSPLRANCCVTMFLQRSAFAVARRAVIRPAVARTFTSSIVRRKLLASNLAPPPQLLIRTFSRRCQHSPGWQADEEVRGLVAPRAMRRVNAPKLIGPRRRTQRSRRRPTFFPRVPPPVPSLPISSRPPVSSVWRFSARFRALISST